jgi:Uma2 family endonuclease
LVEFHSSIQLTQIPLLIYNQSITVAVTHSPIWQIIMSDVTVLDTPSLNLPPNQDQLPCCDGIPMETERHKLQMNLLVEPLQEWLTDRSVYVGGNMFVYFSPHQVKTHDFRGSDVFVVLDVPAGERKSWVVWEEGKAPDIVIELLSDSTNTMDKQQKKQIYQDRLRVPEYFWFDPFNPEDLAGFSLEKGGYQPLALDDRSRLLSQSLNLALVRWEGVYHGVNTTWLRWSTLEGELLPTADELKEQAQQKAIQAQQQAEQERDRAERLAAKLRELGVQPEEL